MNTQNIFINLSSISTTTVVNRNVTIKSNTTLNFVLTGVSEGNNVSVLLVDIDWGDNSYILTVKKDPVYDYRNNSIINEVLYGRIGGSVCTSQSHLYSNTTTSYGIGLTAALTFYYSNSCITTIKQPINVYWASFYDDIKELVAINTQVLPLSTNNTFVNLESMQNTQMIPSIL
jgi:hypothetical protein